MSVHEPGALTGVVTGGYSRERDGSLLSGHTVIDALREAGRPAVLLDTAHQDFPVEVRKVDVALLAIHGRYAEDGKLQGFLDILGVPYTGSGVLASALAMYKPTAKSVAAGAGVRVLPHAVVDGGCSLDKQAADIIERYELPVIVKPTGEGGSIGIAVAHGRNELLLLLVAAVENEVEVMVEPFVRGRSVTVGMLEREGRLTALPILETASVTEFYDFAAKRDPVLHTYHCPADLDPGTCGALEVAASEVHRALGCGGYSRSDFLVAADGDVYWLEANSLPGLSLGGNLATMAAAAGMTYLELLDHILATARRERRYTP